jgi:hypothetical protein
MQKIKSFIAVLSISFIYLSCTRTQLPQITIDAVNTAQMIKIKNWKVLGPFYRNLNDPSAINAYDTDDLKKVGTSEEEVTAKLFSDICHHAQKYTIPFHLKGYDYRVEHDYVVFNHIIKNTSDLGNIYAACIINSSLDQDITLCMTSGGGLKIWLNYKPVFRGNIWHVEKFSYVGVSLKKGSNFLLAKINKMDMVSEDWAQPTMSINLTSSTHAKHLFFLENENNILTESILRSNDTLRFEHPFCKDRTAQIIITNSRNKPVYKGILSCKNGLSYPFKRLNGKYDLKCIYDSDTFKQVFICGDIKKLTAMYQNKFTGRIKKDKDNIIINAQLKRLDYLLENKPDTGQRTAFFEVQQSADNRKWLSIFKGSSKAFLLKDGYIKMKPVRTRYIRVVGYGNSTGEFNTISEIAFYSLKGIKLRAGNVVASSCFGTDYPQKAVDNDLGTTWASQGKGNWIAFDFGKETTVATMSIAWKLSIKEFIDLREWERKTAYILGEIDQISRDLDEGSDPFKNVPGFHIRGFRSSIDNNFQYYTIFTPPALANKPLPLLVYLPAYVSVRNEFLRSMHLADIDLIQRLSNEARRAGFAVLSPCCRVYGKECFTPIAVKDIFEALQDVMKDYRIDTSKIFTGGVCAGAERALFMDVKFPDRFAATGNIAAISSASVPFENSTDFNNGYHFQEYLSNLSYIPLYFIHGDKDDHSPIEPIKDFVSDARKNGLHVRMDIIPDATIRSYDKQSIQKVFSFLKDHVKRNYPDSIKFMTSELKYNSAYWIKLDVIEPRKKACIEAVHTKNNIRVTTQNVYKFSIDLDKLPSEKQEKLAVFANNKLLFNDVPKSSVITFGIQPLKSMETKTSEVEGPINHAFYTGFMVVGNGDPNIKKVVNDFRESWKANYYGECPYKSEEFTTIYDIREKNLILFGCYKSSLIKKLFSRLPLELGHDFFLFRGEPYKDKKACICFIYPNPLCKNKYIVVVESNNWINFKMIFKNMAIEGIHDFIIWENGPEKANVVSSGYFDLYWK